MSTYEEGANQVKKSNVFYTGTVTVITNIQTILGTTTVKTRDFEYQTGVLISVSTETDWTSTPLS